MGVEVDREWGIPVVHHGGSLFGYKSDMFYLPEHDVAAVILVNSDEGGRILTEVGEPLTGEYVVGWIKRGPTGIIGTNKRDAQETVDTVLADLDAGRLPAPADPDRDSLDALIAERQPDAVSYAGWQAIDRLEKSAGEPHGRPRVKLCSFEELLEASQDPTPAR